MKKAILYTILTLSVLFTIVACSIDDDDPATCQETQKDLESLRTSIRDFAATSICNDETECRYIAFGSKPCGGSWEYLIYTTSIDTEELETLVTDFNHREANFNETCGAVSDCSVVNKPIDFTCENNQCTPVF